MSRPIASESSDTIEKLIVGIANARVALERTPEPSSVTDAQSSVHDYDRVMGTNITVNYAMSLDIIHRTRSSEIAAEHVFGLDLCSGPGHLTICQKSFLGFRKITGLDFSRPMVTVAQKNADQFRPKGAVSFVHGSALELERLMLGYFDVVTFTNAAHQFGSIIEVRRILTSMESVCKASGTIVVTDLRRLPTRELTERFVAFAGKDYLEQGMDSMYADFLASMFAAWSRDELKSSIPDESMRDWYYLEVPHLPFFHGLVGVPKNRHTLFQRESLDWGTSGLFRSENANKDWVATKGLLYLQPPERVMMRSAS